VKTQVFQQHPNLLSLGFNEIS